MTDAWKQHHELLEKYTESWQPRADLRVTALATDRSVRLELGFDYKTDRTFPRYRWEATQRNVSTMRELAQALLAACDFVDEANPEWASNHQLVEDRMKVIPVP